MCEVRTLGPGVAEVVFVALKLAGPGNATDVQCQILLQVWSEVFLQQNVTYCHSPAYPEQPSHFVESPLFFRLRNKINNAVADDAVCRVIRQWRDICDWSSDELYVLRMPQVLVAISLRQHVLCKLSADGSGTPHEGTRCIIHVHTNGFARCTDLLGRQEYIKPSPITKVDDYFALEDNQRPELCPMTAKPASFNPAIARGFPQLNPRLAPFGTLLRPSSEYPKDAATVDSYFPDAVPLEAALYRSLTAQ